MLRIGSLIDIEILPMNIGCPPEWEVYHTHADGVIGHTINQNEAAGLAVFSIAVKSNRAVNGKCTITNLIKL